MTTETKYLRDRAHSFRRRAEWMLDGTDRERLIAKAVTYDSRALDAVNSTPPTAAG